MSWTEEKVNKLKELWGKGQTASQIAEIIGGISRNAVIGKAHRLNLSAKIKTRSAINFNNSQKANENSTTKRGRKSKFRSLLLDKNFEPAKNLQLEELTEAMNNNDLLEVADALTDILYVTYGAGHAFGIDLDKCFEEVQNSNMSKLDENGNPIYNDSGKVMKGPNYFKPDLSKFVN